MKRIRIALLAVLVSVIVLVDIVVAVSGYLAQTTPKNGAVTCPQTGVDHYVFIQGNTLDSPVTHGVLCDTLTITNEDNRLRLIAFGPHEHHQAYDGITQAVLSQGQSLKITFTRAGTYTFHDHMDDAVGGKFIVAEN